jgi:hypothetical protein
MEKTENEIYKMFDGKLIGTRRMQKYVCKTLSLMSLKIIKKITQNCWFLASMDDAWAFTFTGNDLHDMHLIFLSDDLLKEAPSQIKYTIAHEVGHVILGHRNSVLQHQTKKEIGRQEEEADAFAKQYL